MNRKSGIVNRKTVHLKTVQGFNIEHRTLRYFPGEQALNAEQSSTGFTSIELIMVIVCLAILTFAIGVRFNRTEIGSAVAADQLIADIRYVQLKAISIGQPYKIIFSGGNSYSLSRTDVAESEKETKK